MSRIKLSALRLDFQPPENLIEPTVQEYVQQIADGEPLEPIEVRFDGESYLVQDGFHRVEAVRRCGWVEIDANVSPGTWQDMEREFKEYRKALRTAMEGWAEEKQRPRKTK
jgi:ParB-like chromosome segregation protein Spo0J